MLYKKFCLILALMLCVSGCVHRNRPAGVKIIDDFSQLNETVIKDFVEPATYDELAEILKQAQLDGTKISIAGIRHSQGGQAFYPGAIVINLQKLNKIIDLDTENKLLTVQAGATWCEIQQFLNQHNLAVKIMQFANIFTLGGALSVNANGMDPRYGTLIESVRSIHIMRADGTIVHASRTENPELFRLAIGGYGLFGVILQATIEVVENSLYTRQSCFISLDEYMKFIRNIKNDPDLGFHFAHLQLTPWSKKLYSDILSVEFKKTDETTLPRHRIKRAKKLSHEVFVPIARLAVPILQQSALAQSLQWIPEVIKKGCIVSRNNIMRPPASHLFYPSCTETNLLQEYFIPVENLEPFIRALERITKELNLNLMHVALRFIPKSIESFLSYTRQDVIGVVLFFSQKMTPQGNAQNQQWTQYLIDTAARLDGAYYLPIQLHADNAQMRKTYPQIDEFLRLKRVYDPDERFMNYLYKKYS